MQTLYSYNSYYETQLISSDQVDFHICTFHWCLGYTNSDIQPHLIWGHKSTSFSLFHLRLCNNPNHLLNEIHIWTVDLIPIFFQGIKYLAWFVVVNLFLLFTLFPIQWPLGALGQCTKCVGNLWCHYIIPKDGNSSC